MIESWRILKGFLPQGPIWDCDELTELLKGIAIEYDAFIAKLTELVTQSNPQSLTEDYALTAQLNDHFNQDCIDISGKTFAENKALLLEKLAFQGGASVNAIENYVALFGHTVNLIEHAFQPFVVGSSINDPLYGERHRFVLLVNVFSSSLEKEYFLINGNKIGDPLVLYDFGEVECLIKQCLPAHLAYLIRYQPFIT